MFRETTLLQIQNYCQRNNIKVKIDEASDGGELIGKAINFNYDLVFTDNQMIKIHGLEAITQIRIRNSTVSVYMVSSSQVGKLALKAGATGYIDKLDYDKFKSGIEDAIIKHLK